MVEVYIVAFLFVFILISKILGFNPVCLIINMWIRVLSGIVFISFCNYFIFLAGGNMYVNINEISVAVSALLGMGGVCFLYFFQWILTIM